MERSISQILPKYFGIALIILVALWLVLTIPVSVGAGQIGVITQFGRVTGRELQPGLNFKLPWPVQGATLFDTQVQKEQMQVSAASSDLQTVASDVAVNYHLDRTKVSSLFQNVGTDFAARIIDPSIQESFKAITANYNADQLITKRSEVKTKALQQIASAVTPYGVIIDDLNIVDFNFSPDFNKAIEAKQVAQQQAQQAQYQLQQAQLQAQAQQALQSSLTPEILEKMAIEKWNGSLPSTLSNGAGTVFNIPTNK